MYLVMRQTKSVRTSASGSGRPVPAGEPLKLFHSVEAAKKWIHEAQYLGDTIYSASLEADVNEHDTDVLLVMSFEADVNFYIVPMEAPSEATRKD